MTTWRTLQVAVLLLFLGLFIALTTAQIEQIESRPLDGHKFLQGQSFRIECRAVTGQELAIRLACPLAEFASGGLATTSCFENCGRPLCNLNDCSVTLPELQAANCSRSVSQVSPTTKEIAIVYTFNEVNPRHSGSYMCQFKTMRSSSYIIVEPVTTVRTSSSTTLPSTSPSSSSSPTTTAATTTETTRIATTTSSRSAVSTEASKKTTKSTATTATEKLTSTSFRVESTSTTTEKILTLPPGPKPTTMTRHPGEPVTSELPLKSGGWFSASFVGTLSGADFILVCVLIFAAIAWLIGFLCIRCQVLSTRYKSSKSVGGCCCSTLLCLGQQHQEFELQKHRKHQQPLIANGGLREFAEQERRRGTATRLTAMSMNAPTAASVHSVSSGQVYADPDGVSYYSPDGGDGQLQHPLVLAGGGDNDADDAYYRLQQDFDDPLSRGGYGTNPRSTFFPRDQTGRHSFHNATPASRQRPGIPREMLLTGGPREDVDAEAEAAAELVAAAVDPGMTRDDFRRQMDEQRREIANLKQQLRNSQLQLNQRSSSTAALKPEKQQQQQQQPQQQKPTSGDYDLLTRVSAADTLPPSPPPPPPPSQQPLPASALHPGLQSLPGDDNDSDLPPLPPPPMSDLDDGGHRRGSLGEAFGTGHRY